MFFRMSYVTDVLRDLRGSKAINEVQYHKLHLDANMAINTESRLLEELQQGVMAATGMSEAMSKDLVSKISVCRDDAIWAT